MGFKPKDMPSAFSRSGSGPSGQARQPYRQCKLVKIDSYDLAQRQLNVTTEEGEKWMVQVRPETIARNVQRAKETAGSRPQAPKWEGYLIDERMRESLPEGQKMVIEKAEKTRTIQHNGQAMAVAVTDRIINIADPSPEKTFEGLFSISTYQNHVFHVQRWEEKAVSIDDAEGIARVRALLDEGSTAFLNKELRPHHGVQFRVVLPAPATERCLVVDTSPVFDWEPRKFDASGQEIAPGHPLSGEKFMELLFDETEGYVGYFRSQFSPEEFPGAFLEVVVMLNYRAGPRSRYMAIPDKHFDPLYKMANTQTRLAIGDDSFVQGKNIAVRGVLQLSADQVDISTRSFKARNIAVRLHATGPMGHVHKWIRTSTGQKTEPHEALKQIPVQRANDSDKSGAVPQPSYQRPEPAASAPASRPAPAPSAAPAPSSNPMDAMNAFDDWGMEEDNALFGDGGSDPTAQARARLAEASRQLD